MTASWLKEFQKYIADIQIFRTFEEELLHFGIIFKFPNGYGVKLEFEADTFIMCTDDYIKPAINLHVEMLDKNGMQYSEESFKLVRTNSFPVRHREQFVDVEYVEEYLKCVYKMEETQK